MLGFFIKKIKVVKIVISFSLLLNSVLHVSVVQAHSSYVNAGNVLVSWDIHNFIGHYPPGGKLTDITFRFTVNNETLHARGTYFAQQFYFDTPEENGGIAYTGVQPQPDRKGRQYLKAIFSTFIANSTSTDKRCSHGADGGPGVSCYAVIPATYGYTYKILVHKLAAHTWSGEIEEKETGRKIHIGTWTLPEYVGDIKNSGVGFSEYYLYYKPGYPQFVTPSCDKIAKVNVTFGPVSTTNYGGGVGNVHSPYEYNTQECLGHKSKYSSRTVKDNVEFPGGKVLSAEGQEIKRGFVSQIK
ncbi:hypothetical protein [Rouxiella sp. Mn2063]|uniref:hypothetical protein n=1 Tax=Rouxiella sp. Mn2063 TaxID=3395262 RepID=UPI003BCB0802